MLGAGLFLCLALAGCQDTNDGPRQGRRSGPVVDLKGMARTAALDYLVAKYERDGRYARRRGDTQGALHAQNEKVRLATLSYSISERTELYFQGADELNQRAREANPQNAAYYSAQAAEYLMKALELDPNFGAGDRETLNAIGYVLADRGQSPEQLKKAVELTQASLKLWDQELARQGRRSPEMRRTRAITALDSYAWALARSGQWAKALPVQEEVIRDMTAAPNSTASEDPTVYYHMGEIYRRNGKPGPARQYYLKALGEIYQRDGDTIPLEEKPDALALGTYRELDYLIRQGLSNLGK